MSIFAATTMLLYLSSAAHHWLMPGKAKDFFEILDHAAIFLMIAGTYTPFSLGILWGPWGWLLMGVIWPLAIFGVLLKTMRGLQPPIFTISLYVAMGWLMVIAFPAVVGPYAHAGIPAPSRRRSGLYGGGWFFTWPGAFHITTWHGTFPWWSEPRAALPGGAALCLLMDAPRQVT